MATKVWAITTAAVENGTVIPNQASSSCPTGPVRPSRNSSVRPPTTGGRTSGSRTIERKTGRPGRSDLASTSARGVPNSRHSAVDVSPVCSESRRASRAASLEISVRKFGQSARSTSPAIGTAISPNPTTAGTHTGHGRVCPAEPVRLLRARGDAGAARVTSAGIPPGSARRHPGAR